jgi:hypothetical protein
MADRKEIIATMYIRSAVAAWPEFGEWLRDRARAEPPSIIGAIVLTILPQRERVQRDG